MRLPALVHSFSKTLWSQSLVRRRSRECTPLYVERYRGPRLGQHLTAHRWWEFTGTLTGHGAIAGKRDYPLAPGTVCLIPPRYRHDERATGMLETIWIGFLTNRPPPFKAPLIVQSAALLRGMEQLWLLAQRRGEPIGGELDAATAGLLAQFLRLLSAPNPQDATLMERAVRHLEQHFTGTIFVEDLAQQFGCSAGYFHRLFKRHTGLTPTAYLTALRIQHARRLLEFSNLSVSAVAREVGYADAFYFSRVFRKLTGHPPTAHRQHAT